MRGSFWEHGSYHTVLRTMGEYWALIRAQSEALNDRDLVDGAGEAILEILREADPRLQQKEMKTKQDLRNAVASLLNPKDGIVKARGEDFERLLIALRLLSIGYYRALFLEEGERVGRVDGRAAAAKRFKERVLAGEPG